MSFTIPADVKARWKQIAKERGISLSEFIRRGTEFDLTDVREDRT